MIDHKGIRGAAVSVFRANMFFLWFFAIPYPTVQRLSPLKICFRIDESCYFLARCLINFAEMLIKKAELLQHFDECFAKFYQNAI